MSVALATDGLTLLWFIAPRSLIRCEPTTQHSSQFNGGWLVASGFLLNRSQDTRDPVGVDADVSSFAAHHDVLAMQSAIAMFRAGREQPACTSNLADTSGSFHVADFICDRPWKTVPRSSSKRCSDAWIFSSLSLESALPLNAHRRQADKVEQSQEFGLPFSNVDWATSTKKSLLSPFVRALAAPR
jgi:hypothetical protein